MVESNQIKQNTDSDESDESSSGTESEDEEPQKASAEQGPVLKFNL